MDFQQFMSGLATTLKGMIIAACALSVVTGAFMYTISGGDPKKITAAKGYFTNAILALIALAIGVAFF